jgi:hypothetical protein
MISGGKVGVGQLFRHLGILPFFRLHAAGKLSSGELWRDYELSCDMFQCRFVELFHPNVLNMTIEATHWTTSDEAMNQLKRLGDIFDK